MSPSNSSVHVSANQCNDVLISLLDRNFAIECSDPRYAELIAEMWGNRPTSSEVTSGNAIPIAVNIARSGWQLEIPGTNTPFSGTSPWLFVATLRSALDGLALAGDDAPTALHAVGVRKDEAVILIVGPAGAGKTSLGLALVDAGWSLVCDDLAPLKAPDNLLSVVRPIGIRSSGAAWASARSLWEPPPWMPEPTGIFFVPPGAVRLGAGGRVSAAFFPRVSPAKDSVAALVDPPLAVTRLASHARRVDQTALRTVALLCRHAPTFELRYSNLNELTITTVEKAAQGNRMDSDRNTASVRGVTRSL